MGEVGTVEEGERERERRMEKEEGGKVREEAMGVGGGG